MPNNVERFSRTIRNLYKAAFENASRIPSNKIVTTATLSETEQIAIQAVTTLGQKIADDKPTAWLRFADQLLDLGARSNLYVDSALTSRIWRDGKASLYAANPTWNATPRVSSYASLVDSRVAGAMKFQGINTVSQYLQSDQSLPTVENFTIEFVVKVISSSGSGLGGGLCNSAQTAGLFLYASGGTIQLMAKPGDITFGGLVVGNTYHCMWVRDARGTNRGYVNGVQLYSGASGSTATFGTAPWVVPATDGWDAVFAMDEVAVYYTALTAQQCVDHYSAYLNRPAAVDWTYAPLARYYEPLAFNGADSSYDSSMRMLANAAQYHSTVLDETTMWCVMRIRPTWAYTVVADKTLFKWQVDANNKLTLTFNATTDSWVLTRLSAAAGATASIASTHAAYADITLAFKVTATDISLSVNGGAWTTVGNTSLPDLYTEFFDLSMEGVTGILWAATGVGTLSDAGLAAAHARGNADPIIKDFGDALLNKISFLWPARDTSHIPIGSWGESLYE